jgi:carbonyl reductase 1
MSEKVAIVTGSNKGIGFAIVKSLCERFKGVVYLTSRNEELGKNAVAELKKIGLHASYHQLDVADRSSVERFGNHIKKNHKGIDILINNAAISPVTLKIGYKVGKEIIDINYRGVLTVEEFLHPLLNDNARVLNISSDCGHLSNVRNKDWIEKLSKKNLSRADLDAFVNWYLESLKNGTYKRSDFADAGTVVAYRVSKVALSALSMIQQREFDVQGTGISVNSMHPGLVSTDMTNKIGFYSPDDAARTPVYLVLDAPQSLKGEYIWFDGKVLDWYDYKADFYFKSSSMATQYLKNLFKYDQYFSVRPGHLLVGILSIGLVVAITKVFNFVN